MRTQITKRTVFKAQPKDRPYEIRDTLVRGLILRVQPSGYKAWIVTCAPLPRPGYSARTRIIRNHRGATARTGWLAIWAAPAVSATPVAPNLWRCVASVWPSVAV